MQLLVEIDEKDYKDTLDGCFNITAFQNAIRYHSTPLPEHHGDLISRSDALSRMQEYHDDCSQTSVYTRLGFEVAMEVVKDAETIIPATKEGECMDEINLPIKHESKPYLMIPFPNGATNGDIIKALFPNDDINPSTITSIIQRIPFGRNEYCSDWWNAPYKKEGAE